MPYSVRKAIIGGISKRLHCEVIDGFTSILCNTSGAGKTALLFQGLCKHWGFYFVAAQDTQHIGSPDLASMTHRMQSSTGWTHNIFDGRSAAETEVADKVNDVIASNRVLKVMLARWKIFRTFVEVARTENNGNLPEKTKHDWLLFQILPLVDVDGLDPFVALINSCLVGVNTNVLLDILSKLTPKSVLGTSFRSPWEAFFYVLDEAQVAGDMYMGAFCDGDGLKKRPVLRPLIRTWASGDPRGVRFIVSGTGFSLSLFKTVLTSGVGKPAHEWKVVHETGDFIERRRQELYVTQYLPVSFLSSPSGTALLARMHEWLRGR
jgi:hypothetical protein